MSPLPEPFSTSKEWAPPASVMVTRWPPEMSVTVTVGDTPSAPGLPWGPVSPAAPRGRPKVSFTTPSVPVPLVTVAAAPVPSVVAATSMFSIFFSLLAAAAA